VQEPAGKDWAYWVCQYVGETVGLAYSVPRHLAARLSPAAAERLFCGSRLELADLHQSGVHELQSFLRSQVWYRGSFQERELRGRDVQLASALPVHLLGVRARAPTNRSHPQ